MDASKGRALARSRDRTLLRRLAVLEGGSFVCTPPLGADDGGELTSGPVLTVAFANAALGGALLASAAERGDVTFTDARHPGACRALRVDRVLGNSVFDCAWSADDATLFVGGATRTCVAWDVAGGAATVTLGGHGGSVRAVRPQPGSMDREWEQRAAGRWEEGGRWGSIKLTPRGASRPQAARCCIRASASSLWASVPLLSLHLLHTHPSSQRPPVPLPPTLPPTSSRRGGLWRAGRQRAAV